MNGVKSFTLKNCIIGGFNPEKSTQPIHFLSTSPDPVLVTIEDNEFIASNENCYNLINIYGKFMDGSSISRNTFRKGCCTHNLISFFAVDEGATVYFNNNVCEYVPDMNMVHVQIPEAPNCTIYMENNTIIEDASSGDAMWDGLFIVQPFNTNTTTYENVTIHCNKNNVDGVAQVGYIYMHGKNTPLTEEQFPKIFIDGEETKVPVYRPEPQLV